MKKTIRMILERETKGAVRYMEVGTTGQQLELADAVIGTLYLRKSAFTGRLPEVIIVTVADVHSVDA